MMLHMGHQNIAMEYPKVTQIAYILRYRPLNVCDK